MEPAFILAVPVLQIVFSVLRGEGKINVPIGAITIFAIVIEVLFLAEGANMVTNDCAIHQHDIHAICATNGAMFFMYSIFIDFTTTVLIGIISAIVYNRAIKNRKPAIFSTKSPLN